MIILLASGVACSRESSETQTAPATHFIKLVYDLNQQQDSIQFTNWVRNNFQDSVSENYACMDSVMLGGRSWATCYYQDEEFKILGECRGEFGGSLFFIDKENPGNAYYLSCTCPAMVEKRGPHFYVTETLSHGVGHGRIVKIAEPRDLMLFNFDRLALTWNRAMGNPDGYEELSNQGQIVVDTVDYTFSLFYQFGADEYLIYSDNNTTYLGRVYESKIEPLDTLMKMRSTRQPDSVPGEFSNGIYHYKYSSGDIFVKQDTIVIGYFTRYGRRLKSKK
jgi:hypothetical protein